MTGRILASILVFAIVFRHGLTFGIEPGDDERTKDLRELKGAWSVASIDIAGGHTHDVLRMSIVIHDDKLSIRACPTLSGEITALWDATKSPKQVDFADQADGKPSVHRALYRLDGDNLMLVVGPRDGARPTEFKAEKATVLIVLERAKR